jgi:hypothetical protein
METTPNGTTVGVDDPYALAGRCDHVTGDGRCRLAIEHPERDRAFARERRREACACPVVARHRDSAATGSDESSCTENRPIDKDRSEDVSSAENWAWWTCRQYRSRTRGESCRRCGLEERRMTAAGERPLLEEHHLSYGEAPADGEVSHEITIALCRWCHAKVHGSWARVDDTVSPDPEAIAAREGRRSRERAESAFETAAQRRRQQNDFGEKG